MKLFITTITLAIITIASTAQTTLMPGERSFEKKWIKSESYQMTWFAIKDTAKLEIGIVANEVIVNDKLITIVTQVNMKNRKARWVDSTVAVALTLQPVSHASYNMQRDMVLNFGKVVTGFYNDKLKPKYITVSDTTTQDYFDSNLYPVLITWLPLKEGYKKDISIYDYNPSAKNGVMKAFVKGVTSGKLKTVKSGIREVWVITVTDELGDGQNGPFIYYIDKADRKLWKQEINAGGQKMLMLRKEL